MSDKSIRRTSKGHDIPISKRKKFDAILNAAAKSIKEASRVGRPKK